MPERIPQSSVKRVAFKAYLASDHITPATGKTIAVTISKNGAAYANPSGGATNATEIGSGSYYVDLSTTDTGILGPLFVKCAEGTIDQVDALFEVAKATNAGFTALPDAAAAAAGGLPTVGTGSGQVNPSGGAVPVSGDLTTTMKTSVAAAVLASPTQKLQTDASGSVLISGSQVVPLTGNTANSVFDCLNAARAQGFGKWTLVGTSLTLYGPDGLTVVRTFTLDSATTPTQRS